MSGWDARGALILAADVSPLYEPALFDALYRAASPERQRKTDRLRFLKDKCLSLGAEALLRAACAEFGADGAKAIAYGPYGKPEFTDGGPRFSLSHSGERVLCAVSELPVGCDVEQIRPRSDGIAGRFFSKEEIRALEACRTEAECETAFFRLWTLKESFVKCTGLGFHLPFGEFSVILKENGAELIQTADEGAAFRLAEYERNDGYRYAWCVRETEEERTGEDAVEWKQIDRLL